MIDLSVIIVNYNGEKYLKDCLSSIYQSTKNINFEIIFVDNHSADNSVDIIKTNFPKVIIIENKNNHGFCRANNQGLKIYQGRYALLLNNDTIVKDGALDQLVQFMDNNPGAGACGPLLSNPDGSPQHQGGIFNKKFWLSSSPTKVSYVIGAALMVRREVVDKVGGMDENFFFSNDDLDWCLRIKKASHDGQAGWDIYFVPQAKIMHYGGFTINKFNQKLFVEGFRGGLYFCRKHYGFLAYQLYRSLLIIGMIIAIPLTLILYPFLKHKKKLNAFIEILMITLQPSPLSPLPKGEGWKNILLVSNGHAEDLAAAAIGGTLQTASPDLSIRALPLVGLGQAYDKKGIINLGLKKILPSGGFAKEGIFHFLNDLRSGFFSLFHQQIKILRQEAKKTDLVVAVGDVWVVALCGLFVKKPLIFIDGPKSVKIEGYYKLELWLLKKFCQKVIVQDPETADYLQKKGIPAFYLGSWVMDYVPVTGDNLGIDPGKTVIGILPGTREEAYPNLKLILEVFELLSQSDKNLVGTIASVLNKDKIKIPGWQLEDNKLTSNSGATAYLIEGKFGDVCVRSKLIIGLAGIANEQAVAFGKPVVCFPGSGAQTTLRRWQEIHKITSDSMLIVQGNTVEKAAKIMRLLKDEKRLAVMGKIGKESKPMWGGVERIANLVKTTISN
ncbi:MAG: lipid-A-disaccharide synthase-related protein [bacterium]